MEPIFAVARKSWPYLLAFAIGFMLMFVLKTGKVDKSAITAAENRAKRAEARADSLLFVANGHYRLYQADSANAAKQQTRAASTAAAAQALRSRTHVAKPSSPRPVSAADTSALRKFWSDWPNNTDAR